MWSMPTTPTPCPFCNDEGLLPVLFVSNGELIQGETACPHCESELSKEEESPSPNQMFLDSIW